MRPWKELTWTDLLILGTSASTAAGALYLLMAGDEEELTLGDANGGPSSKQDTLTSKQTVIQVKIPKEAAGHVIGQQGIVIKQVCQPTEPSTWLLSSSRPRYCHCIISEIIP